MSPAKEASHGLSASPLLLSTSRAEPTFTTSVRADWSAFAELVANWVMRLGVLTRIRGAEKSKRR